jgi:DNA polymerase-3 subunit delta
LKQEFNQIISDLQKKIYHPIYFLFGDEAHYIDKVVDYIDANVLNESEKAFNQQVLYGKDVDAGQIVESAMRLPMMSNYQVVIIKEAQQVKTFGDLASYFAKPTPSTLLVLAYKHQNPDKRKTVFKDLIASKHSVAMESKAIRDYEVSKWISSYASTEKLKVSPKGIEMLAEFLGPDIAKIVNELDKLKLILGEGVEITEADIEKNIGASKDYNIFEFTKAVGERNTEKTFRILQYFEANPKNLILTIALGTINVFFHKLYLTKFAGNMADRDFGALLKIHPFIAKDYKVYANKYKVQQIEAAFEIIGDYDLKSKGLGSKSLSGPELLTEMTYKIFAL